MGNVGQKSNRINFLNGVFSGKQVFLSIISGNTEKGVSNCFVDLRLEAIKNNLNIVRCTNMRKYNCRMIIATFCCNTWQNIKAEMKINDQKIQTNVLINIHLHLNAQLASVSKGCIMAEIEKFCVLVLQLSFMTTYFTGLLGGVINTGEISPCYIARQN